LRALILNFLLCHPKNDFLRDCQKLNLQKIETLNLGCPL